MTDIVDIDFREFAKKKQEIRKDYSTQKLISPTLSP